MHALKLGVLLAFGFAGFASAESFTFVNTNSNSDQVMLNPPNPSGRPMGAVLYSTKSVATYSDGKKTEADGRCAAWILPPGDQFGQNGACEFKDAKGPQFEVRFTCAAPQQGQPNVDCWGALMGTGGAWKGRSGAFSGHGSQAGFTGEGHWN